MIRFCELADIAPADALTGREWEALARLAVVLEDASVVPHHLAGVHTTYEDPKYKHMRGSPGMVECKLDLMARRLYLWVREQMSDVGLNSQEFVAIVAPYYAPQEPTHRHDADIPAIWTIALRLRCERTAAKAGAEEASHTPTLAEQHGKARS